MFFLLISVFWYWLFLWEFKNFPNLFSSQYHFLQFLNIFGLEDLIVTSNGWIFLICLSLENLLFAPCAGVATSSLWWNKHPTSVIFIQLHPALVPVQFKDFSSFGTLQIVSLTFSQSLFSSLIPVTNSGFSPLLCSQLCGQRAAGSVIDHCWWILIDTS